jgi:plasmid stabilization system protein ParE
VERLYVFLQEKSPAAAARAAETILSGANLLQTTPALGRLMSDETGRRELFLPFGAGAYVLRYRVEANTAVIIRVWHSRESRTSAHRSKN